MQSNSLGILCCAAVLMACLPAPSRANNGAEVSPTDQPAPAPAPAPENLSSDERYRIEFAAKLRVGEQATPELRIVPQGDLKWNELFPANLTLGDAHIVSFPQQTYTQQAKEFIARGKGASVSISTHGKAPGTEAVPATLKFALCKMVKGVVETCFSLETKLSLPFVVE